MVLTEHPSRYESSSLLGFKANDFIKVSHIAAQHKFLYPPTFLLADPETLRRDFGRAPPNVFELPGLRDFNRITSLTGLICQAIQDIHSNSPTFSKKGDFFLRGSLHQEQLAPLTLTYPGISRSKSISLDRLNFEATDLAEYLLGAQSSAYGRFYEKITNSSISDMTLRCILISPLRPRGCLFSTTQFNGESLIINTSESTKRGSIIVKSTTHSKQDCANSKPISKLWHFCDLLKFEFRVAGVEIEHCEHPDGTFEILQARPLPGLNIYPHGNCIRHTPGFFEGIILDSSEFKTHAINRKTENLVLLADFNSTNLETAARLLETIASYTETFDSEVALILRYPDYHFFSWHLPSALFESNKFKFVGQVTAPELNLKNGSRVQLKSDGQNLQVKNL